MVRQTARSIIFILFCCSFLFPANGGVGQECEAIKDIDLDWMYKKETLNLPPFNPDLPRSIQWSKEGHSLAYLISNVTEAPHLVVYDPAKDATAFLVTPHALHEAVIALASQPEGVTIEAACAMRTVPEGATDVASIDWYEWQSETMGIRLHSQGKTYTWDMEVNLLKEEPTDARKLPEGEKNDTEYSPNERYAAYTRANDLYVFDLEQMKELRLTEDGSVSILNGRMTWVYWEELHYRRGWGAFIWSPNNDALAYLQFNEQGVSTYPVTDFSNPVPNTLNMFYPKVGTKNPDVRLGVVTLSTRDTRWIDLGEPDEYIARVAWTPDGQTLAVQTLNREQTRLTLRFADPWTGRSRVILQEEDPAWVNAHGGPYFLEEQDGFLWFSERSGYRHLYKYSLDGSQCTQLTQGEWEVNPSLWQIGVDLDEKNNRVLFNANESSPLEKQYYAVSLDG
ncbi:MAG: DPP IV N-terminal domain-containing protein, partial [bacterium]|nr:DPP IV N-terminal domain-containing protein [bacterium]